MVASKMAPPSSSAEGHDSAKRLHQTFESDERVECSNLKKANSTCCVRPIDEVLPEAMLMEVFCRLPDARDLVGCALVNHVFLSSFKQVKTVRFLCKLKNFRRGERSTPAIPFKDVVTGTLHQLCCVERLSLQIEDEMQANRFKDDEIERNSLWLSEVSFIEKWLHPVFNTLQDLTVIDYGQQAIFHATPLLMILSIQCKQLRTLELRNMFLDCRDVSKMSKVTTLSLHCVKLTDGGLEDLNNGMPALETLTLANVVGLKKAEFNSEKLKVLCLGLIRKVKSVKLIVPNLVRLQLNMQCPDQLTVDAPALQALCLAVYMDKREKTLVQFMRVTLLKELLGALEFTTLTRLSPSNPLLEKVFLDVPCMAFEKHGSSKGVLAAVTLAIHEMEAIRNCCPNLQTLSVGPGLWCALEKGSIKNGAMVPKWPTLKRLILHLIVQEKSRSVDLLTALVRAVPTLEVLEVYVHTDSNVDAQEFMQLRSEFPQLDLKCDTYRKGLKFDCFSF